MLLTKTRLMEGQQLRSRLVSVYTSCPQNGMPILWEFRGFQFCAITHITLSRTSPFKLGPTVEMIIWMNVWRWEGVVHSIQLVLVVEHRCLDIGAKTAWWDHYGAKVA